MSDSATGYGPQSDALIAAISGDDGQMRAALDQLDGPALLRLATCAETVAAACRALLRSPRTSAAEPTMTALDTPPADIHPAAHDPARRWFRVQTPSRIPDHHYLALDPEGESPRSLTERMRLYATMTDPADSGHAWFIETALTDREASFGPYLAMLQTIGFVEVQREVPAAPRSRRGQAPSSPTEGEHA